jgi:hypothetical protein
MACIGSRRALLSGGAPPSLDLRFTAGGGLDPRITFTRASTASYFDSTGTLQSAATNVPRFDFDPALLTSRGLLIEGARTNLLLNSATLSTQSVTTTATPTTLSFYGTGTVTLSGTFAGSLVGAGAFPARSSITFTPTAGTLTCTVTGSVLNAQVEAGAFPTSYIPTTGTTATRALDAATMPWVSVAPCSAVAEVMLLSGGIQNQGVLVLDDGTITNRIVLRAGSGNIVLAVTLPSGVSAQPVNLVTARVPFKIGGFFTANSGDGAVLNGGGVALGSGVFPSNLNTLRIGTTGVASGSEAYGYIRRLRYWPRAMGPAELAANTR